MSPADEAAQIFTRLFETLARGMNKRLKEEHRAEIRRACELLTTDGNLLELDDLPPATMPRIPARDAAAVPPEVDRWRTERTRQ